MTTKEDIQKLLEQNPEYKEKLFIRGYYFTNDEVHPEDYPFYGLGNHEKILGYNLLVHNKQTYYINKYNEDKSAMILIGHAYNPFTMQYKEPEILEELATLHGENFGNKFNELTGIFTLIIIHENDLQVIGDPTCMQCNFYGCINKKIYLSSHVNAIGDLLSLQGNPDIKELTEYKFFPLLGNTLPGDITQYAEVKHLVPNHYLEYNNNKNIIISRFYTPKFKNLKEPEVIDKVSKIVHWCMKTQAKKGRFPHISVTGGCDSKTTIACANGLYKKFRFFSYISNESEKQDALAGSKICKCLNVEQEVYDISNISSDDKDFFIAKQILQYNCGNLGENNKNDINKRIYLDIHTNIEIDIKSHISEQGRAYYSKRFNRKNFGKNPTPRKCTTLYKFFLQKRSLVKKIDLIFKNFINNYFTQDNKYPLKGEDGFLGEHMGPSKNALIITGEQKYSCDITIPYNNRLLMELMMSMPFKDRLKDTLYIKVRNEMNKAVDECCPTITNLKHTRNRARLENLYYILHSHFPF